MVKYRTWNQSCRVYEENASAPFQRRKRDKIMNTISELRCGLYEMRNQWVPLKVIIREEHVRESKDARKR